MKHWKCTDRGEGVSCVCGVAMREGDTILIADACHNDSDADSLDGLQYVTPKDDNLPKDAMVTVSDSGLTFKVSTYGAAIATVAAGVSLLAKLQLISIF